MISLITVGMNHRRYLEALYGSLYKSGSANETLIESIYVDNCSSDDSINFIQKNYPQVKIVKNVEPLGFGENSNKGVMASIGEYIGIINPDIVFLDGSLDKIMKLDYKLGITAPKLLNPDGSVQFSVRKFVTIKMMLMRWLFMEKDNTNNSTVSEYLCKNLDQTKRQEVDWAMGAALFMSRETYALLGGFDQRYFLYMEDEDLCLRAWKQNIPVLYEPSIELIHNHQRGSIHIGKKTLYHLNSLLKFFRRHGINTKRENIKGC